MRINRTCDDWKSSNVWVDRHPGAKSRMNPSLETFLNDGAVDEFDSVSLRCTKPLIAKLKTMRHAKTLAEVACVMEFRRVNFEMGDARRWKEFLDYAMQFGFERESACFRNNQSA